MNKLKIPVPLNTLFKVIKMSFEYCIDTFQLLYLLRKYLKVQHMFSVLHASIRCETVFYISLVATERNEKCDIAKKTFSSKFWSLIMGWFDLGQNDCVLWTQDSTVQFQKSHFFETHFDNIKSSVTKCLFICMKTLHWRGCRIIWNWPCDWK